MLRQIEWWPQNGPITMSGVLPVTNLFFRKICSNFRTFQKEFIWCTDNPNVYIRIFRKRWSLILGWFFPVSILKTSQWYVKQILPRLWDISKTFFASICDFSKIPHKIVSCDFRRVIKISDKIDVGPLKNSQQMKSFQVCVCVCMCVYVYVLFPFIVKAPSD